MITKELYTIHRMLKEKTPGFEYFSELIKLLNSYSYQIFYMRNIDQNEWERIKDNVDHKMSRKEKDKKEYIKIDKIQRVNTEKLKEIINKKGCITISRFGIIASHSTWLIVQHSDHDKDFRILRKKLMKENKEDVFKEDINKLERRIVDKSII